jgi:hypothetical protein
VTKFPAALAVVLVLVVLALLAGVAEVLAHFMSSDVRLPIYCGGAAGVVLGLAAIPFMLKLAELAGRQDNSGAFWKWWGGSLLARLFTMLGMALTLISWFESQATAALLSLIAVYLIGMFVEAAWLANVFIQADKKK